MGYTPDGRDLVLRLFHGSVQQVTSADRPAVRAHHVRNAGNCLQGRLRPTGAERGSVGSRRPGNDELRAHGSGGQRAPGNPRREVPTCGTYPFRSPDPAGTAPGTCPSPASTARQGPYRGAYCGLFAAISGAVRRGTAKPGGTAQDSAVAAPARGRPGRFGAGSGHRPGPHGGRRRPAQRQRHGGIGEGPGAERRPPRQPVPGRDPQEVVAQLCVHPVRPDRGGHGPALPPRGHGPRPRGRHVRLRRLLRRPHRRRDAGGPRLRLAGPGDVVAQHRPRRPRADRPPAGPPRRRHVPRRRVRRPAAPLPAQRAAPAVTGTVDR